MYANNMNLSIPDLPTYLHIPIHTLLVIKCLSQTYLERNKLVSLCIQIVYEALLSGSFDCKGESCNMYQSRSIWCDRE